MEVRSAGLAIVVFVNLLVTFIIAQMFMNLLYKLRFGSFFFFAAWEFIATSFNYFFVPETKNIPIEEIVLTWNDHWFWKRIVKIPNPSVV